MTVSSHVHGRNAAQPTKRALSQLQMALVELMQRLNFGRIERLTIVDGEPVIGPTTVVVREHKFGGENGPRSELNVANFALKRAVVELLDLIAEIQNDEIDQLEVRYGLPFRVTFKEVPA